uniref:Uncharacterized protein n=1 Tax=Romanomermis culicivorax TaxID=13658 RepID=A0A915J443_ROMCU
MGLELQKREVGYKIVDGHRKLDIMSLTNAISTQKIAHHYYLVSMHPNQHYSKLNETITQSSVKKQFAGTNPIK